MIDQGDIFRDDPRRVIAAWRTAAETALLDPHYTLEQRQRNHDYYAAEADRLEREYRGAAALEAACV